ncbi:MAG: hypothetical protein R3F34_17350 [Planctomycetota bacterium]
MKIIDIDEHDKAFHPHCPHCKAKLEEVYRISDDKGPMRAKLGYAYCCPHCESVLGFADIAG